MEKIYSKDINKVMPILQALAEGKIIQFAATYYWAKPRIKVLEEISTW